MSVFFKNISLFFVVDDIWCSVDTAFIASRGQWLYCDDSRIVPADPKDVVVSGDYLFRVSNDSRLVLMSFSSSSSGSASVYPVLQEDQGLN